MLLRQDIRRTASDAHHDHGHVVFSAALMCRANQLSTPDPQILVVVQDGLDVFVVHLAPQSSEHSRMTSPSTRSTRKMSMSTFRSVPTVRSRMLEWGWWRASSGRIRCCSTIRATRE